MSVIARSTALAAVATLTLAACSTATTTTAGSTATPTTSSSSSATVMPEAMDTATPHDAADVLFAQQMIVHHQGAIEMAEYAVTRASSEAVKDLAATIKAAQAPEIEQMTGWLQAWGTAVTDLDETPKPTGSSAEMDGMSDMGHGADGSTESSTDSESRPMPGMMSADDLTELAAATGGDFDKMFLQMMIVHHQGAIEMADTEIAEGSNTAALALAAAIKTSQTAEIAAMQQLLANL